VEVFDSHLVNKYVSCTTGGILYQTQIWIEGEPSKARNAKACTAVTANSMDYFGFKLVKCDMEMGIVCQVSLLFVYFYLL
jgi:hypothetical protein